MFNCAVCEKEIVLDEEKYIVVTNCLPLSRKIVKDDICFSINILLKDYQKGFIVFHCECYNGAAGEKYGLWGIE